MSGLGFGMKDLGMKDIIKAQPRHVAIKRAILFIIPSVVITVISIILFSQLRGFTIRQLNVFSITIISAVVLSLIGMAAVQFLIYRIIDDREYFKDGSTSRAIKLGMVYSLLFSLIISAVLNPYFTHVLGFSRTDYLYFPLLLLMYSAIWIYSSAYWASEKYLYPALIFSLSYVAILGLTLFANKMDPTYTLLGYSLGTAVLFISLLITSTILFRKPETHHKFTDDLSKTFNLVSHNGAAILFSIFYVIALFLDKIIVWVHQGMASGQGLLLTGTYGTGAFLGLTPLLSIAIIVYFSRRANALNDERYAGTFTDIKKRASAYQAVYWSSFRAMIAIALGLFALTLIATVYFIPDSEILSVLITTSIGSIFFSVITFNSVVLPIFGKTSISTVAMLVVIIFEILSIRFVSFDVWYASIGFLLGSFTGFLISITSVIRVFYRFEYNLFRYLLHSN